MISRIESNQQMSGTYNPPGYYCTDKVTCPNDGFLTSFMLKVQDYQGIDRDDTTANDLQFRCSNTGMFTALKTNNGGPWGTWGCWSDVCSETGICGIETRVDLLESSGDETALNDVRMYCCPARK